MHTPMMVLVGCGPSRLTASALSNGAGIRGMPEIREPGTKGRGDADGAFLRPAHGLPSRLVLACAS